MKFKPGQSGNPKGRPRGATDKTGARFRALIRKFVADNWHELQTGFNAMKPAEKAMFLERLLKNHLPPPVNPIEAMTDEDFNKLLAMIKKEFAA